MSECIFCKIANGQIPCMRVYEDDDFLAFLDIMPINLGHTLIIPKVHCKDIHDFPSLPGQRLVEVIQKVAAAVIAGSKAEGVNLGMNNGSVAGQAVFHAHIHIIPRFSGDGLKSWGHKELTKADMEAVHKDIVGSF